MRRLAHNYFDDAAPFKIDGVYCRLIPLTRGQYAIVEISDYLSLSIFRWFASFDSSSNRFYARRNVCTEGQKRQKSISMHRVIMNEPDAIVDHKNPWNTLDNRRSNLRTADDSESACNQKVKLNSRSGFKGVSWCNAVRRWRVRIMKNGKVQQLALCDSAAEGARIYNEAAQKIHSEFSYLNSI